MGKTNAKTNKGTATHQWRSAYGLSGQRHRAYSTFVRSHAAVLRRIECLSQAQGVLTPEWYDVLLALENSPEGRLRIGDLTSHVNVSRSGLTRLVDKLEAAGLVERQMNRNDRRSFEVILTPECRAERAKTWPTYARIIAEVFGNNYSDEEAALLASLLERQLAAKQEDACDVVSDAN